MLHIAIIIVTNTAGEVFLHRRRRDKRTYPGRWGIGAGGHIEPTESPADGAARELWEEAGLRTPLHALGSFPFTDATSHHEVHLFATRTDARHLPNHDAEWDTSGFVSPAQVAVLMAEDALCPDAAEGYRRFCAAGS